MGKLRIAPRFNGPPDSGNGGYVCGLLGSALDGPAVSTLKRPPPLGRELLLTVEGGEAVLLDGDEVVGTGTSQPLDLDLPDAPSFDEAVKATRGYPWFDGHIFPTCFVCGPGRPDDDGMKLYPGWVEAGSVMATPWLPDASLPHRDGRLHPEIVWAALDCPSYFVFHPTTAVLGRLHADLRREVRVGERYVVASWEIGREGRKLSSASAVFDEDGRCCAAAAATWIALKKDQGDFRVAG